MPDRVRRPPRWALAVPLCALASSPLGWAPGAAARAVPAAAPRPSVSATLEGCTTADTQSERSATFAGEMTALSGGARMEMRIDLLERTPAQLKFRTVTAPGLGQWRVASPGVKVYKYVKQVTNLAAPATYSAAVRFRWLSARGRVLRVAERHTATCEQPALLPAS